MKRQFTASTQHKEGENVTRRRGGIATSFMLLLTISRINAAARLDALLAILGVNKQSTASNLLFLSLTLSTRNAACRTRMGSSCACALDPGMMLALGKLSHGNRQCSKYVIIIRPASGDIYWTQGVYAPMLIR